jgi:hypothetical protein
MGTVGSRSACIWSACAAGLLVRHRRARRRSAVSPRTLLIAAAIGIGATALLAVRHRTVLGARYPAWRRHHRDRADPAGGRHSGCGPAHHSRRTQSRGWRCRCLGRRRFHRVAPWFVAPVPSRPKAAHPHRPTRAGQLAAQPAPGRGDHDSADHRDRTIGLITVLTVGDCDADQEIDRVRSCPSGRAAVPAARP